MLPRAGAGSIVIAAGVPAKVQPAAVEAAAKLTLVVPVFVADAVKFAVSNWAVTWLGQSPLGSAQAIRTYLSVAGLPEPLVTSIGGDCWMKSVASLPLKPSNVSMLEL